MSAAPIDVVIKARHQEAREVVSLRLQRTDGGELPAFDAGAHVDLHLPGDLVRQYSLLGDPHDRSVYEIAVLRDPASRGGSSSVHDRLHTGEHLRISPPRNLFALDESAPATLLFAGGIGITPILAMAQRLAHIDRPFALHYSARSRQTAAFLDRLSASAYAENVHTYFDDSEPAQRLDIGCVLDNATAGAHIYVCGPSGLIDYVLNAARLRGWPQTRLHREDFAARATDATTDQPFRIRIGSSGMEFDVPAERTALAVLRDHGFDIPTSCEIGVCGTCVTHVLDGRPDHRDFFLSEDEQASNGQFTPCCSRAHSPLLVLDL